jgi:hypothetical protein
MTWLSEKVYEEALCHEFGLATTAPGSFEFDVRWLKETFQALWNLCASALKFLIMGKPTGSLSICASSRWTARLSNAPRLERVPPAIMDEKSSGAGCPLHGLWHTLRHTGTLISGMASVVPFTISFLNGTTWFIVAVERGAFEPKNQYFDLPGGPPRVRAWSSALTPACTTKLEVLIDKGWDEGWVARAS